MVRVPVTSARGRAALLRRLEQMLRKTSAQSVLISDLVANRVGLNSTDLECLDLLYLGGATTVGRLASHTGLTSGATTAVIDRLERAGYVRRRGDPRDRRRVMVEALAPSIKRIQPLYAPLAAAAERLHRRYDDRALAVVVDYLDRAFDIGAEHVAWLQTRPAQRRGARGNARRGTRAASERR